MAKRVGHVVIDAERCKGCGLCVASCPVGGLRLSAELNHRGYHPAQFVTGAACTGCGVCFYACPEPAALTVYFAGATDVA
jgi:NAD-dependent dihydropyrimidine dehydrogenase PreA subunit